MPFRVRRVEADETIRQLQKLPNDESKELADLKAKQREAQLTLFLERFYLDHPSTKIKGVGSSRKIMLRSYGIETAADVQQARIQHINGFGPVITGAIISWRKSLERRFVFNPKQPIDPSAVSAIKAKTARQHLHLQRKLQDALTELQKSSGQLQSVRRHLRSAALAHWQAKRQADLDAATYLKIFSRRNRFIAVAFASLAALLIPLSSIRAITTTFSHASAGRDQIARGENLADGPPYSRPTSGTDESFAKPASLPPTAERPQILPSAPNQVDSAARQTKLDTEPSSTERVPPLVTAPPQSTPAAGRPQTQVDGVPLPTPATTNVADPLTPKAIQMRLRALGYASPTSGVWDSATRDALRDFKVTNDLDPTDVWDLPTEQRLRSDSPLPSTRSFVGSWSDAECRLDPGQNAPLSINSRRAKSLNGGTCEFIKITYAGAAWRILALCQVGHNRWTANITLTLNGDGLTWASERGVSRYFRCR